MNVFNQGRKLQELRAEFDSYKKENDTPVFNYRTNQRLETLEKHISELEKAMIEMQAAHSADIKEIRELLEIPQRRKSTVRPWTMLRSVAEAGERFMKDKQGA